jgi:2-polyprenyl-3-methyl-5-hydroxy-6-metoxy-1,4-benzoquinol methylase
MNYEFEKIVCNVCESDNYSKISSRGQFGFPINVVLCKKCSLMYLNPRWNEESYIYFYMNEYDKYYRPKIREKLSFSTKKSNFIEKRLKKYDVFPNNVKKILDIGSGEGENLLHFKSLFPKSNLYAIEPSLDSQLHLKSFNVNIIDRDVNSSWEINHDDKFDLVIMRHVLEHFLNPVKIMKKVFSVLKPNGIVYIAVPNALKPKGDLENFWFRVVHTYYFNKYSLENINKIAGLKTIQMVEGDQLHETELYCIATKNKSICKPEFSSENFKEQFSLTKNRLKSQKSIVKKLRKLAMQILKKYF